MNLSKMASLSGVLCGVALLVGCSSPPKRLTNTVMLVRTFKPPVTDRENRHLWSLGLTENHSASLTNAGTWGEGDAIIPSLNAKIGDRFSLGGGVVFGKAATNMVDRTVSTGLDVNAQFQIYADESWALYAIGSASWMTADDSKNGNANVAWEKDPETGMSWTPTDKWTATSTIKFYEQQLGLIGRYSLTSEVRLFVGPALYHTSFYSKNTVTALPTIEQRFTNWNPAAHVLLDWEPDPSSQGKSSIALFLGGTYVQLKSLGDVDQFKKNTVTVTAGIDLRF